MANPIFLAGTFLFEGGAVAWGLWELWKIRPGREDKETSAFARRLKPSDSPEPPGHAEGEHGPDDG